VKFKDIDKSIVGKIKDRHGNEYDVLFFENSSDFPDCHILTHARMKGRHDIIDDSKETVRITREIWDNIGIRMKWKRVNKHA